MHRAELERVCFPHQPFRGKLVIVQVASHVLPDLRVGLVQPVLLFLCQQANVNKVPAVGHHGDVLKAQIRLVAELVLGLHFAHDGQVLNADAVVAILVVARLDGQHVAGSQRDIDVRLPSADTDGPLVDVQERSNSVAGSVTVVKAIFLW